MLPPELLINIFKETPRNSLFECLFVCKSWYTIASHVYYNQVELVLNHLVFLKMTQIQRIDHSFLGDHVRKLVFLYRDRQGRITRSGDFIDPPFGNLVSLDKKQFHNLIAHLPCLETIQFNAPSSSHYLHYLKDVPRAHLSRLQDIVLPGLSNSAVMTDYVANVNRSFDTIARFHLDTNNNNSDALLSLLSKMTQLKHLTCTGLDLASVLNACHDLVSLDITHVTRNNGADAATMIIKHHPHMKRFVLRTADTLPDKAILDGVPSRLQYCRLETKQQWSSALTSFVRHATHLDLHMATPMDPTFWAIVVPSQGRNVRLEVVLFDSVRQQQHQQQQQQQKQSIRVRQQGEVCVKVVLENLETLLQCVHFDTVSTLHIQSHVVPMCMNEVMAMLQEQFQKGKCRGRPGKIHIQCYSGSLDVDNGLQERK